MQVEKILELIGLDADGQLQGESLLPVAFVENNNINIEVKVDGSGAQENAANEIANAVALKLRQVFANMPLAAGWRA